jgi:hypothetical protein
MRLTLPAALLTGLVATPALAGDLTIGVEIPRMTVAEYHRPYVAIWIEKPDETAVKTLAVWYDVKNPKGEGANWLKDVRQWWRRAGRSMTMPANGVSGPTKAPGKQQIIIKGSDLAALAPGQYNLVVEAAREVGGREIVRIPFTWSARGAARGTVSGKSELGTITLSLKP